MSRFFSGGKRQREADRDRRKQAKEERLRRNRQMAASGMNDTSDIVAAPEALPEINIDDVVIGVRPQPRRGLDRPTKLFIGGLSWDTNDDLLRGAFSKFGTLVDAAVVQDRNTGRSRGFGFVTFENDVDAETAIKQMNGAELDGRTLRVNRAEPR
jgi:hypothetical protein